MVNSALADLRIPCHAPHPIWDHLAREPANPTASLGSATVLTIPIGEPSSLR
jgi:hypothetical protein